MKKRKRKKKCKGYVRKEVNEKKENKYLGKAEVKRSIKMKSNSQGRKKRRTCEERKRRGGGIGRRMGKTNGNRRRMKNSTREGSNEKKEKQEIEE